MYRNISHVILEINKCKDLDLYNKETKEYINQNEVGFYLSKDYYFDIAHFSWVQDKAMIAYPNYFKGKELYGFWKGLIVSFKCSVCNIFDIDYTPQGIHLKELKSKIYINKN